MQPKSRGYGDLLAESLDPSESGLHTPVMFVSVVLSAIALALPWVTVSTPGLGTDAIRGYELGIWIAPFVLAIGVTMLTIKNDADLELNPGWSPLEQFVCLGLGGLHLGIPIATLLAPDQVLQLTGEFGIAEPLLLEQLSFEAHYGPMVTAVAGVLLVGAIGYNFATN
ncbi:hypothetical protein [Halopiger goleimassiliensis]|uniref:hypothetical protein n=1 Tax=Halopiger goleimassiliensis TaxID=1293048 RepID=UPI00067814DB|nr:hypothetical protein [Halopiger goleimassiliensis]